MANSGDSGAFINGREKAVEILAALQESERQRILKYIQVRNPEMGKGLSQECFHLENLVDFESGQLDELCQLVNPKVLGIALKKVSRSVQRDILKNLQRGYVESCYEALVSPRMGEDSTLRRAEQRVLEAVARIL